MPMRPCRLAAPAEYSVCACFPGPALRSSSPAATPGFQVDKPGSLPRPHDGMSISVSAALMGRVAGTEAGLAALRPRSRK